MIKALCIALTLVCLAGCSKPGPVVLDKAGHGLQQKQRPLIVGKWYSDSPTTEGGHVMEIAEHRANGTYVVSFRVIDKTGKVKDSQEAGFWGTAGNIYFTITKGWIQDSKFIPAPPGLADLEDAYQILELKNGKFRYRSVENKNVYSAIKVDDTFQFPGIPPSKG
ncbi:hypothetical protein ACW9IK_05880 [Pseudomonas gingeri]|uniref:hypothetical protein n=1 Tax=Pseudomonas gingeri TaxID=117681 RepID=UPI0015A0B70A|nr:hypothetical protein [Pseudomonas gingeri]NWE48367.1 hypothetical protein [Pseudomonas gingeri]